MVVLHAGAGHDVTLTGYLFRVVLSLVAVGGVALVVYWSVGRVESVRPAAASRDDRDSDRRDS